MIYSFSKLGNGGGGGGDATVLEPKTSIPASGAAGTLIATNLAEHQEWQTLEDFSTSGWTAVRGLCNEDTWLNVRFLGYENRYNGSFNGSEWINGGPENWYSGWSVEWDGNNWTATNNDWLSVTGTTDGNTWQIDFSIAAGGVNDGWDIPSNTEVYLTIPQTVGLYQANSTGTYAEIGKYATEAGFTRKMKKYQGYVSSDPFNAGDMIISEDYGYRPRVKTSDGDGFDSDFESLAYQSDVDSVRNDLNLIDTSVLQSTTAPSNSKTEKGTIFSVNSVASSDYVSVPTTDSWLPSNSFTKAVLNVTDTSATKIQNLVISTTSDAGYCTFDFYEKITLDLTGTTPFIANDTSIDGGVSVSGNTVFSNRYPFIRLEWNSSDSQLIVYCPFTAFFNNDGQIRTFDANDNLLEVWEGNNVDFYKTSETYDTNPQIIGSQSGYVWTLLDNGEPYPQVEKIKFPADYEYADSGIRYNDTDSGIRLVYMMNFKDVNTWYTGWNKTSETDESCVLEKDFNGQTLTISATTTADKKFVELTFSDAVSFSLGWWSSRRAKDQKVYEYRNVGKPQNLVVSESVMKIVKLSQAEYDALSVKSNDTIYVII